METYTPTNKSGSYELKGLGTEDVTTLCDKRYVNETGDSVTRLIVKNNLTVKNDLIVSNNIQVENNLLVGNQCITNHIITNESSIKECTIKDLLKVTDVIIVGKASYIQKPVNSKHLVNKEYVDQEIGKLVKQDDYIQKVSIELKDILYKLIIRINHFDERVKQIVSLLNELDERVSKLDNKKSKQKIPLYIRGGP